MTTRPTRNSRIGIVASAIAITVLLGILGALSPPPAVAQDEQKAWPPEIKNLQVFPEDMPIRELIGEMRDFSSALGVRCQFCHVGEEGQPLASFDFATDEKPEKNAARLMLRMVRSINKDHLSNLAGEAPALTVQCVTCHRGTAHPEQLHDLLVRVASTDGGDAALAKYGELRQQHHGGQSYDFGEQTLVRAASALAFQQNVEAAESLIRLNLEHFPESTMTLGSLAQLRQMQGDNQGAIAALEKVLELDPENGRVQAMLEQLNQSQMTPESEEAESENGSGEPKE